MLRRVLITIFYCAILSFINLFFVFENVHGKMAYQWHYVFRVVGTDKKKKTIIK